MQIAKFFYANQLLGFKLIIMAFASLEAAVIKDYVIKYQDTSILSSSIPRDTVSFTSLGLHDKLWRQHVATCLPAD